MFNIIAIIILILSVAGIAILIYRKIPMLAIYVSQKTTQEPSFASNLKTRFSFKMASKELFLQKFLSKFRILILKTDNKTSEWMRQLREKSIQNKTKFSEGYWAKLKK